MAIQSRLKISIREGNLEFFQDLGPLGTSGSLGRSVRIATGAQQFEIARFAIARSPYRAPEPRNPKSAFKMAQKLQTLPRATGVSRPSGPERLL